MSYAVLGVFVCNGQYLICLQLGLQGDVAHCVVDGIFRCGKQAGLLNLLVVDAAAGESLVCQTCNSGLRILTVQLTVKAVG